MHHRWGMEEQQQHGHQERVSKTNTSSFSSSFQHIVLVKNTAHADGMFSIGAPSQSTGVTPNALASPARILAHHELCDGDDVGHHSHGPGLSLALAPS